MSATLFSTLSTALLEPMLTSGCKCHVPRPLSEQPVARVSGDITLYRWSVQEAPREWFQESSALQDVLESAAASLEPSTVDAWKAEAQRLGFDFTAPAAVFDVSVDYEGIGDNFGYTYGAIAGHIDGGWLVATEAKLGEFCDEEADGDGSITLAVGEPEALRQFIGTIVAHEALELLAAMRALSQRLPESLRPYVTEAIKNAQSGDLITGLLAA